MNCENCKKRPATVFYADESGGRHSLCAPCAKTLGKISQYDPAQDTAQQGGAFLPLPTLTSLTETEKQFPIYCSAVNTGEKTVCPYCATSLESAVVKGQVGCPECYTVFAEHLFPSSLSAEEARGAKMPSTYRASIERIRSVSELKTQIKLAIECEDYELAATLRDKIRKLEGARRA